LIGVLLFASPTLGVLIRPPSEQHFSELYILGSKHMFENIPFDIRAGVTYTVYLGIVNQMGSSCYYTSFVKLGNETQSLPNSTQGKPSSLPILYQYKSFLSDGKTQEEPLTFQVNALLFAKDATKISAVTINGVEVPVQLDSSWNSDKTGYYYNLFVELWIYNSASGISQYHNRYINLILNMTQ
jgi:uncharacterized membrane protein